MPQKVSEKLKKLRIDVNKKSWSDLTFNKAPHKPLLLLAVMDLYATGTITGKFIEPNLELVDTFNLYWQQIMPVGSQTSMAYPFPRLHNDKIWKLKFNPGYGEKDIQSITSMVKLKQVCIGTYIDDELYQLFCNPQSREYLRATLINTYFVPELHSILKEQGVVNIEAFNYSNKILQVKEAIPQFSSNGEKAKKVRDQGFRKVIVNLYDHRCAMCGIRMLTPEGHTVVEAAHVVPWSENHDDRPTNGMALCKLCHWSFDEGLMSVGNDYEVLVSKRVRVDKNLPGHILSLSDRPIFRPDDGKFWPGQGNLGWHRDKRFC